MKQSLRQRAYEDIHGLLVRRELTAREPVSTQQLSERLGIGRTPVREALNQLQDEGYVKQIPKIGIVVQPMTWPDVRDMLELRRLHECYAITRAARLVTSEELEAMRQSCLDLAALGRKARDQGFKSISDEIGQSINEADIAFHELIVKASRNRQLDRILRESRLLRRRLLLQSEYTIEDHAQTLRDHWHIYRAIKRGDAATARSILRDHLRSAHVAYKRAFKRQARYIL